MVRRTHRTTTHRSGGILSRLRGRRKNTTTITTTTKTTRTRRSPREPVHHHRRRPSIGDKISGAFMKLEGALTRRPGLKVSISAIYASGQRLTIISRLPAPGECTELMGVTRVGLTKVPDYLVCEGLWLVVMACVVDTKFCDDGLTR